MKNTNQYPRKENQPRKSTAVPAEHPVLVIPDETEKEISI